MSTPQKNDKPVTEGEILTVLRTIFTAGTNPASIYSILTSIFKPRTVSLQAVLGAVARLEREEKNRTASIADLKSRVAKSIKEQGQQQEQ